jgi:hypothetical protein
MSKWEDNINMDIKINKIWGCGLESFGLVQSSVAGSYEYGNEISG